MSYKKSLLSLAVAAGLGAVSLQANAAAPTVYGDLSYVLAYTGASTSGGNSSYSLGDNISLIGVKGEAAKIGDTSYYYDFNLLPFTSSPVVHLAVLGAKGSMGDLSVGTRVNGLFSEMVDGGTYQTNFYYTPGMTSLQVSNGITYKSNAMGGFQVGVQAFDIAKDSAGKSYTNYTVAGTYGMGSLTFGLGYTKYADNFDNANAYTDTDMLGENTDVYDGITMKSVTGLSVGYKASKFGVVAAYDSRKPLAGGSTVGTAMVTGSYSVTGKTTLVGNISSTSQSGGVKGTIVTAMVSYAPSDALLYTFEIQNSNKDANKNQLSYATTPDAAATKGSTGFAAGVIWSF